MSFSSRFIVLIIVILFRFLCISAVWVVISPLWFLILFIWVFCSWWAWSEVCQFLYAMSKNQLLVLLIFFCIVFKSLLFPLFIIPIFITSFRLLTLGLWFDGFLLYYSCILFFLIFVNLLLRFWFVLALVFKYIKPVRIPTCFRLVIIQTETHSRKRQIYIFLLSSPTVYNFVVLLHPHSDTFAVHFGNHCFHSNFILLKNLCTYFSDLLSNCDFLFLIDSCMFST